jgi:hypothetical protein
MPDPKQPPRERDESAREEAAKSEPKPDKRDARNPGEPGMPMNHDR